MRHHLRKESTNVLIIGKSGVGKSSLINYMFGKELQAVGVGEPVTKIEIKPFTYKYDEHFDFIIFDTWGLEPSIQKADTWKDKIFNAIKDHDKKNVSEWFNTIIFCLNAKSSRVEDFELDIMQELLQEKNCLTVVLTHCNSKEDPDALVLKESIKNELQKRNVDTLEDNNFVFVSNVKKKLIGGTVEQFGKEELFTSIIRNVWTSLKRKVPYQTRKVFNAQFQLKKNELLKKPDSLKWIVPFMKVSRINMLEKEINSNCEMFVKDLENRINEMYNDAIQYYTELSKNYAVIGFQADPNEYLSAVDIRFDAMQTIEAQVASDLKMLRERMQFVNDILRNKKVESTIREGIINFKVMVTDSKAIRKDLKAELNRYIDSVYTILDKHLTTIEEKLNSLEINDLCVIPNK